MVGDRKKAGALEQSNLYYYEKLTGLPILGKLPSPISAFA